MLIFGTAPLSLPWHFPISLLEHLWSTHPPSLPSPTLPATETCLCDCRTSLLDLASRDSRIFSERRGSYFLIPHFCRVFGLLNFLWLHMMRKGRWTLKEIPVDKLRSEIAISLWTKVWWLSPRKGVVEAPFPPKHFRRTFVSHCGFKGSELYEPVFSHALLRTTMVMSVPEGELEHPLIFNF